MVTAMGLVFLLIGLAIAMLGPVLAEVAVAKRPRRKRRRGGKKICAGRVDVSGADVPLGSCRARASMSDANSAFEPNLPVSEKSLWNQRWLPENNQLHLMAKAEMTRRATLVTLRNSRYMLWSVIVATIAAVASAFSRFLSYVSVHH